MGADKDISRISSELLLHNSRGAEFCICASRGPEFCICGEGLNSSRKPQFCICASIGQGRGAEFFTQTSDNSNFSKVQVVRRCLTTTGLRMIHQLFFPFPSKRRKFYLFIYFEGKTKKVLKTPPSPYA